MKLRVRTPFLVPPAEPAAATGRLEPADGTAPLALDGAPSAPVETTRPARAKRNSTSHESFRAQVELRPAVVAAESCDDRVSNIERGGGSNRHRPARCAPGAGHIARAGRLLPHEAGEAVQGRNAALGICLDTISLSFAVQEVRP